jgi:N,N'-diacetyllegionaminate synthase
MKSIIKIIAEVGVNHDGNFNKALNLIDAAKDSGANFVKFQLFKAENLVTINAKKAEYQKKYDNSKSQFRMLKKLELSNNEILKIIKYTKTKGIDFLATPFDVKNVEFLKSINQRYIKISSGDINNYPLLEKIGKNKREVFMSTGMSTIKDIFEGIKVLVNNGTPRNKISIFHCTSAYPTPINEVNLNVLKLFSELFGKNIGYSDHTTSLNVPSYAVLLGAKIIEKHITLNNKDKGPDHAASLNPKNFKMMVENIREAENSLGLAKKFLTKSEKVNQKVARRSIYASKSILKGEIFSKQNIITKRPATGVNPMLWNKIVGKKSKKNFKIDEKIKL